MIRRCCSVPKFLLEVFELVGNTATDLSIELQSELLKAHQTFTHDKTNDHYNLGYSNLLQLPILVNYDLFKTRDYFFENRMDWVSQAHILPLSARVLSRKPRFNSRGNTVTHLTTHENRETNCWSIINRFTLNKLLLYRNLRTNYNFGFASITILILLQVAIK